MIGPRHPAQDDTGHRETASGIGAPNVEPAGASMDGVVVEAIGGNCPVQANGTVDGTPFYFRARGEHWSMEIGPGNTHLVVEAMDRAGPQQRESDWPAIDAARDAVEALPVWRYEEDYGEWPAAGWMSESEALEFIAKAANLWRQNGHDPVSPTVGASTPATDAAADVPHETPDIQP